MRAVIFGYFGTLTDPGAEEYREPLAQDGKDVDQIHHHAFPTRTSRHASHRQHDRVEGDRPPMSPRRLTSLVLTHPDHLTDTQRERHHELTTACPEMTALTSLVGSFAALLRPATANNDRLTDWISAARQEGLPHLHAFTRALDRDRDAVDAAVTLSHHNGTTEGVNTKTKLLKRQMYGRAGFTLLRPRILLG